MKLNIAAVLFAAMLILSGCTKSVINDKQGNPNPHPNPQIREIYLSPEWSPVTTNVYVASFPDLFKNLDLKGKEILVYGIEDYGGYKLEAIINQRSAPFNGGRLWAEILISGLDIYFQTNDITHVHFEYLQIKVVIK